MGIIGALRAVDVRIAPCGNPGWMSKNSKSYKNSLLSCPQYHEKIQIFFRSRNAIYGVDQIRHSKLKLKIVIFESNCLFYFQGRYMSFIYIGQKFFWNFLEICGWSIKVIYFTFNKSSLKIFMRFSKIPCNLQNSHKKCGKLHLVVENKHQPNGFHQVATKNSCIN